LKVYIRRAAQGLLFCWQPSDVSRPREGNSRSKPTLSNNRHDL
jgi:hypothetical protein